MLEILLFLATFLLVLWLIRPNQGNRPPTPGVALPILGHLYMLKHNPMDQIKEWRKRLGDVFALNMGGQRVIVLNGYHAVHEALVKRHECFLGRPDNFLNRDMWHYQGIMALEGNPWKNHRAFLHTVLRSLGLGKNIMAQQISKEVDVLLKALAESNGEPKDFSYTIQACTCNVVCGVTLSLHFDSNDPEFAELMDMMSQLFQNLGSSAILQFFPSLKYVPGDPFNHKKLHETFARMRAKLKDWIAKSRQNFKNSSDEQYQNVTQAFLDQIEADKATNTKSATINEENMLASLWGLFNAGTETTSTTILCACLYMINFPKMQDRLYREIEENVGHKRLPSLNDRPNLKYLNAFIMETLRFTSIVPMTADRMATKDTKVHGYHISPGENILVVIDSLLWDELAWGDPDIFRPERFLENSDIKSYKEYLPFLIGRRNCLGEALAVAEIFLTLAALIQKFELVPESPTEKPPIEFIFGFTRNPKRFKMRALPRTTKH